MNTKEIKNYLLKIQKLDRMIERKLQEIERWQSMCEYPNAPSYGTDKVQSSGGNQKLPSALDNYISMKHEIGEDIKRLSDAKREIISNIEQLPPNEYEVIYKRYVELKSYNIIADEMGKSYSWCTTVHGRALQCLKRILE